MALAPGTTLGPYEVLVPLGEGGMGEVYRARDAKLARDVAIKVLPESMASDAKALARFEHEARAVAALSHPNILSIFDFGSHDGTTYAVTELLEGETFRELLRHGPLSPRRATELATQVAHGLAAAHGKGVVHRDLKPENLFLTADGLVKILDFGVAHRTEPVKPGEETSAATVSRQTDPGAVLGTVGYMSPEQVRGEVVDHRSDLFSFGAVLYVLLTGRHAFRRGSAAETMAAILNEEPPEIEATGKPVPQGLKRVVEHCLEKSAARRFHDAEDLAFALESAIGSSASAEQPAAPASLPRRTIPLLAALAAVVLALALALPLGFLAGRTGRPEPLAPPRFTQLTFTGNPVVRGRFTHDGRSVVYSEWPEGIRELTLGMALPRPVLGENTRVLSVSATDQLAVAVEPASPSFGLYVFNGSLGVCPLAGALPRTISKGVLDAAWHPDGTALAVIRYGETGTQVEYPEEKVIARLPQGRFGGLRFSPDGKHLAMFRHPLFDDDAASVVLMDPATGRSRDLTGLWASTGGGVVWRPDGKEIWFSASKTGESEEIHAVNVQGRDRRVLSAPLSLRIDDIAPDGRALVAQVDWTADVLAWEVGSTAVRRLGIRDFSRLRSLRTDGKVALVDDQTEVGTPLDYDLYLRPTDGSLPTPIGRGVEGAISPDGQRVLVRRRGAGKGLFLVPAAGGKELSVPTGGLDSFSQLRWSRAGDAFVVARRGADPPRLWKVAPGMEPEAVGPPFPPDARLMARNDGRKGLIVEGKPDEEKRLWWADLTDPKSALREIRTRLEKDEMAIRVSADDRWLYLAKGFRPFRPPLPSRPLQLLRLDLETGRREPLLKGGLPAEFARCERLSVTEDASHVLGQEALYSSQLFLVEGLK